MFQRFFEPKNNSANNPPNASQEGFLCPDCHKTFTKPELLQSHFDKEHPPENDLKQNTDKDVSNNSKSLDYETNKKISSNNRRISTTPITKCAFEDQSEMDLLQMQLKASEESRTLLNSEVFTLRQDLKDKHDLITLMNEEKVRLELNLREMSDDVTRLNTKSEENNKNKVALEDHISSLKSQLNEKARLTENLETQLTQRPTADDVLVLRKELIHAQTLMDNLTKNQEAQIEDLKNKNNDLVKKNNDLVAQINLKDDAMKLANDQIIKCKAENEIISKTLQDIESGQNSSANDKDTEILRLQNKITILNKELLEKKEKFENLYVNFNQISTSNSELQNLLSKMELKYNEELNSTNEKCISIDQEKEFLNDSLIKSNAENERLLTEKKMLTSKIDFLDETVHKLTDKVLVCEETVIRFENEKKNTEIDNKKIIENLKADIHSISFDLCDKTSLLEEKDRLISDLQAKVADLQSISEKQQNDLSCANEKFKNEKIMNEKYNKRIKEMISKHTEFNKQIDDLKNTIDRLEKEREELFEKMELGEGKETAILQLQQEINILEEKINANEKLKDEQVSEKCTEIETLEERITVLEDEKANEIKRVEQLRNDFSLIKDENTKIIDLNNQLTKQISSKDDRIYHLEQDLKDIEISYAKLTKDNETEINEKCAELNKLNTNFTQIIQSNKLLSEKCEKYESEKNDIENDCKEKIIKIESLECELAKFKSSINEEIESLNEQLNISEHENLRLHENVTTIEMNVTEKENIIKDLNNVIENQKTEETKKENEYVNLIKDKQERFEKLEKDFEMLSIEHIAAIESNNKFENEVKITSDDNQKKVKDFLQQINKLKEENGNLESKLNCANKNIESDAERILSINNENEILRERIIGLEQALNGLKLEISGKTMDIDNLKAEIQRQHVKENENTIESKQTIKNMQSQLSDLREKLDDKSSCLDKLNNEHKILLQNEEKLQKLIDLKVNDLETYRTRLKESEDKYYNFYNDLEANKKLLEEERQSKLELETSASQVEEMLRHENNSLQSRLEDEIEAKIETEKNLEQLQSKYDTEINSINDMLTQLRQQCSDNEESLKPLQMENEDLRGQLLEKAAQLDANTDERRILLERCLTSEDELRQLRDKTFNMRRKQEDLEAALHELGRENQSLQIYSSKFNNRKWADDNETAACKKCNKEFSLTIRKHHCRNCGNIFCNECSSKNAITAASKNAVRVCEQCYNEITNK